MSQIVFLKLRLLATSFHLAGQLASDFDLDIKGQTQQTFDMIDQFLADAGTDKSHILSVTIYFKRTLKMTMQRSMKFGMLGLQTLMPYPVPVLKLNFMIHEYW